VVEAEGRSVSGAGSWGAGGSLVAQQAEGAQAWKAKRRGIAAPGVLFLCRWLVRRAYVQGTVCNLAACLLVGKSLGLVRRVGPRLNIYVQWAALACRQKGTK